MKSNKDKLTSVDFGVLQINTFFKTIASLQFFLNKYSVIILDSFFAIPNMKDFEAVIFHQKFNLN